MNQRRSLAAAAAAAFCIALIGGTSHPTAQNGAAVQAPRVTAGPTRPPQVRSISSEPVDFNWDVRPILSDNCFRCHGSDARVRQAGLRLDMAESALGERKPGSGRYAIVPGQPALSEVIARITNPDPKLRMPPQSTHKVLTPEQIATIRTWIE